LHWDLNLRLDKRFRNGRKATSTFADVGDVHEGFTLQKMVRAILLSVHLAEPFPTETHTHDGYANVNQPQKQSKTQTQTNSTQMQLQQRKRKRKRNQWFSVWPPLRLQDSK
jgi:hypothetical protein